MKKKVKKNMLLLLLFFLSTTINAEVKDWNFMVYIASNNNLHSYAMPNIQQMQKIGSNKFINLTVQIDTFRKRETKRYFVDHGKSTLLSINNDIVGGTSGTGENLFNFVKSITTKYPAKHHALVLWNHGSGIKDPHIWGKLFSLQEDQLFFLNPETRMLELNTDLLRGIAFNETQRTYISNQELTHTLNRISKELLGGKKIDILGMDACHMAMIEIGSQIKSAANYMVGSQEVVPGSGWDYTLLLNPFLSKSLSPSDFAKQIVDAYSAKYNKYYADLTMSAADLKYQDALEKSVNDISAILLEFFKQESTAAITHILKSIRNEKTTTISFMDKDYIDLHYFYRNLLTRICNYYPISREREELAKTLKETLIKGMSLISDAIIRNSTGRKVRQAGGLSIYFPVTNIHSSYLNTIFHKNTKWAEFLSEYFRLKSLPAEETN